MSWLYSQALVAAFSADTCSDGGPSAPSSATPTPQAYCLPDRMTAVSRLSRFGMTFAPLTDDRGEALLMSYRAGFHAKTSAPQERAQALTAHDPASGLKWHASLAKFDPATSSWRTVQPSLFGDLDESSVIWPRSGMTAGGRCWAQPMSAHRTSVNESGLWPTPTVFDSVADRMMPKNGDTTKLDKFGKARKVLRDGRTASMGLARLVAHEDGGAGQLNPPWVEWLMGWPLGWTDLKPLETAKFHEWQQQHSMNYLSEAA